MRATRCGADDVLPTNLDSKPIGSPCKVPILRATMKGSVTCVRSLVQILQRNLVKRVREEADARILVNFTRVDAGLHGVQPSS
jgi:hypothetical protein